jgi:Wzt C-terminal domain
MRPLLQRVELYDCKDRLLRGGIPVGGFLRVRIYFRLESVTSRVDAGLGFDTVSGQRVFTAHTAFEPNLSLEPRVGDQVFTCDFPNFTLVPGHYRVKVSLDLQGEDVDAVESALLLTVVPADFYGTGKQPWSGACVMPQRWYEGNR